MSDNCYYFGYGSLVNRKTRDTDEPWYRATLNGWVRQWAHRASRPWTLRGQQGAGVCALTVMPRESTAVDGVLVPVAATALEQLDIREANYHRVMLPLTEFTLHDQAEFPTDDAQIIVYVSDAPNNHWANQENPLITSYVHCVMDGFKAVYGVSGLERFMHSTEGWSLPSLDDRFEPIYPRAVNLDPSQQAKFDQLWDQYAAAKLPLGDLREH